MTTTALPRTPQDDLPANILASRCPSRTVMRHLTDRWTPFIVAALSEQPVARFGELKAMIQGISPKVLTQTALGTTLIEPMTALRHWAQDNMHAVLEARERYNAAELENGEM